MKKCLYSIIYVVFFVPSLIVGMYSNSTMVVGAGGAVQGLSAQTNIRPSYDVGFSLQEPQSTLRNRKQRREQGDFKRQATRDQKIVAMNHKINKYILNANNDSCFCDRWLKYWSAPRLNNFYEALEQAETIESYIGKIDDEQVVARLVKRNDWFNYVHSSLIDYTVREAYEGHFITGKNIDLLIEGKGHLFPTLSKVLSKSLAYHVKERYARDISWDFLSFKSMYTENDLLHILFDGFDMEVVKLYQGLRNTEETDHNGHIMNPAHQLHAAEGEPSLAGKRIHSNHAEKDTQGTCKDPFCQGLTGEATHQENPHDGEEEIIPRCKHQGVFRDDGGCRGQSDDAEVTTNHRCGR